MKDFLSVQRHLQDGTLKVSHLGGAAIVMVIRNIAVITWQSKLFFQVSLKNSEKAVRVTLIHSFIPLKIFFDCLPCVRHCAGLETPQIQG